jgi:hypothetical protein
MSIIYFLNIWEMFKYFYFLPLSEGEKIGSNPINGLVLRNIFTYTHLFKSVVLLLSSIKSELVTMISMLER